MKEENHLAHFTDWVHQNRYFMFKYNLIALALLLTKAAFVEALHFLAKRKPFFWLMQVIGLNVKNNS